MDFTMSEEDQAFGQSVRRWVEDNYPKHRALEIEAAEEWPRDLFEDFAKAGFHGIGITEEYGGQGGGIGTQMVVARELSRSLGGMAWVWGISSFAGSKSVGLYGTEEQKRELLPRIAAGELVFAIAVTEPEGGTDVLGALRTTARRDGDDWVINGSKMWCTQAHVADYLLLLARTDASASRSRGLTLFLVPGDADGVTATVIPKLGMRALGSCEVVLEDVRVPAANVLGEIGGGWGHLLGTLNNERIMVAALALGVLDGVIEEAERYMHERQAFGGPIARFQVLQHYYADMLIDQQLSELITFKAAWLQQQGLPCGREATMAKVVVSEAAVKAADAGIQIMGGMGYAADTQMQRYWRDARLWKIGPVTSEMARNVIAEMAGMPRSF